MGRGGKQSGSRQEKVMKGSSRSRLESIYLSVRDEEVKENGIENELHSST